MHELRILVDAVAGRAVDALDDAVARRSANRVISSRFNYSYFPTPNYHTFLKLPTDGPNDVLHLHGDHDDHRLVDGDRLAWLHEHLVDDAGHGRDGVAGGARAGARVSDLKKPNLIFQFSYSTHEPSRGMRAAPVGTRTSGRPYK